MSLDFSVVLLDIATSQKFDELMISDPLVPGSQAATGSFSLPPWIAMIPAGWLEVGIQILPGIALFLFGLIVGTFFFRRRPNELTTVSTSLEGPPEAASGAIPDLTPDETRLESALAESRQQSEARGREVERLNSDLLVVREEVAQARARMEEWKEEAMALSSRARERAEAEEGHQEESSRLNEEIQGMRFAAAARDGEIARLKSRLARRESELEQAEAEIETARAERELVTVQGSANPIASRLGRAEPVIAGISDERIGGRRFIRRLLGIRTSSSETAGESLEVEEVALSPTSLAEARAALSELKHSSGSLPGLEGEAADFPAAGSPDDPGLDFSSRGFESDEVAALRRRLEAQEARIAELESELEQSRGVGNSEGSDFGADSLVPGLAEPGEFGSEEMSSEKPGDSGRIIGSGDPIPVTDSEMVLFRGTDPRNWNPRTVVTDENGGGNLARPVADCPEVIDFIRLCRLDTGESVVSPITREELLRGGSAKATRGWSGRGEEYFGACHLGFFAEGLPRDVETKFGFGGWGFGHREGIGAGQAFGWAGRAIEIPGDGFSISVGRLPEGTTIPSIDLDSDPVSGSSTPEQVSAKTVAAALAAEAVPVPPSVPGEETGIDAPLAPRRVPANDLPDSPKAHEPVTLSRQADRRTGGVVLFRANDPALWNTDTFLGANRRSRSLESLPEGLAFLRLKRIDTGEGVVVAISNEGLVDDADGQPRGFNGTNELFYGAHHLGIFDESLPQDVETRFTYGGWGFGHSVMGSESQASGWEGKPIDGDTVFEIAVFRRMPILGPRDRMLD